MNAEEMKDIVERSRRCVCRQCGTPLRVQEVIFNEYGGQGYELVCPHCQRIEYGVEPEIFEYANKFVREYEFNYFMDMPENERNIQMNVSKVCELFTWLFKEAGICTEEGLTEAGKAIFGLKTKEGEK